MNAVNIHGMRTPATNQSDDPKILQPSVVVLVGMDFLLVFENHQALFGTQCRYVVTNHSLARILDAPGRIDGKPTTVGAGQISGSDYRLSRLSQGMECTCRLIYLSFRL
jgi:hypothetical protein